MITLVHEDIYLYIDPVQLDLLTLNNDNANPMTLYNDATEQVVDNGILTIEGVSGSVTGFTINDETKTIPVSVSIGVGDVVVMNFRERYYTKNGVPFLLNNYVEFEDNVVNALILSFSGTGSTEVKYEYYRPFLNNDDLFYCTSFDLNETISTIEKNNIKNQTKNIKNGKKSYTVSINGLWNETEVEKFESESGYFRLRLIDEEGFELDKISNFVINQIQKSSSELSDLTYNISGVCDKVFK